MALSRARLFGLTVESDIPLGPLAPAGHDGPPDVTITRTSFEEAADFAIEGVARYRVSGGTTILVDAEPGAPAQDLRLYLLGSAFGLLMHQRGLLPLHANSIDIDGAAIAVAGPSGAGKSTLAAWFHDQHFRLLGDDVCAVDFRSGEPMVLPGLPRLRLWGDAVEGGGRSRAGLERSYLLDSDDDKWDVPLPLEAVAADPLPLHSFYVLEDGPEITIERLTGAAAADALFTHTYRGSFMLEQGLAEAHWRAVLTLIGKVQVFRLARPFDPIRQPALGPALLAHARAQTARTSAAARSR